MVARPKRLAVLSYAVNGRGLGHLSRQIAIQRWIRRYATFAGVRSEHWFLTTSEADTLLHHEGFAGFKLPSKSVVEASGIGKPAYLALAKQWVWHSLSLVRPDLLVVDTFPNGSFSELHGVLDLCRHKALVMRPVKPALAARPSFRALAGLYDRIVVPQTREVTDVDAMGLPTDRTRVVGPVMRTERFESHDRAEARARLGVPADARCILVCGGGGGDEDVPRLYDRVEAIVAADPATWGDTWWVFAAGPLYRGRPRSGPRRVWWTTPDLPAHLAAFDGAVSAAGFNSLHELLFWGVPTVFVPQTKIADDQLGRVEAYERRGAARRASLDGDELPEAMRAIAQPAQADRMSAAARQCVPHNHAREAARQILGLCLPTALLDQAHAELDDALLTEARDADVQLGDLVDLAVALHAGRDGADELDRAELDLGPALELLVAARATGAPDAIVVRIAQQLIRRCRGVPAPSPAEIAEALELLVTAPALTGQWSAMTMLLGAVPSERQWGPVQLVQQWGQLADEALDRGHDVLSLARLVLDAGPVAGGEDDGGGKNAALIAFIRERLSSPPNEEAS